MARDFIRVRGISLACVVGVRQRERREPQPLLVDLELGLDLRVAGRSGRIRDTVDYDRLTEQVQTLLQFRRYRLLENAAEEVAAMLFGVQPALQALRLTLIKPLALAGRAQQAEVHVERCRADFPRGEETARFGRVEVLLETREAGLYLLHIAPRGEISSHYHQRMRELEWRVSGSLARDGERLTGLSSVVWPKGQVHHYQNLGDDWATLFCCDTPPFIPEDEVLVEAPAAGHAEAR
ncbi:MAG: dihydroneopterin aldolase [Polyangiaceae bacterium]|nr:dihydroneopterin aldolase [Polyangiaceae bacterium]MCW5791795.1 dihydroneopterin aldolase [Polyangiaceae bacterium]